MLAEHGPTADIPLPDPIPETPTLPVRKMRKAVGVRGLRVDLHRACDPARSVIASSRMPSAGFSALMGTGEELVPLIDGRPHTGAGVPDGHLGEPLTRPLRRSPDADVDGK